MGPSPRFPKVELLSPQDPGRGWPWGQDLVEPCGLSCLTAPDWQRQFQPCRAAVRAGPNPSQWVWRVETQSQGQEGRAVKDYSWALTFWTCGGSVTLFFFPIFLFAGGNVYVCLSHHCILEAYNLFDFTGSHGRGIFLMTSHSWVSPTSDSDDIQMGLWLRPWRIHLQCKRPGFDRWVGKIPWRREWLPIPVFLPGECRGQRSLVGYSP